MSAQMFEALGVAVTLERVATRIERDGWNREGFYPGWDAYRVDAQDGRAAGELIRLFDLPCCVTGGIYAETDTDDAARTVCKAFELHLDPHGCVDAAAWNDFGLCYGREDYDQRSDVARVTTELRRAAASIREAIGAPRAGDIGDNPREYELEPLTTPEIAPAPVETPVEPAREPVPA